MAHEAKQQKHFWIRSCHGKYVRSAPSDLESTEFCEDSAQHSLVDLSDTFGSGKFALKSHDGRYWTTTSTTFSTKVRLLKCPKDKLRDEHTFLVLPLVQNKVAIRSCLEKSEYYLCAERSGRIVINRKKIGHFETFTTNLFDGMYESEIKVIQEQFLAPLDDDEENSDSDDILPHRRVRSLTRESTFHLVKFPSVIKDSGSILCGWIEKKGDTPIWELWSKSENGTHVVKEVKIEHQRWLATEWTSPFVPTDPTQYTNILRTAEWCSLPTPPSFSFVGSDEWNPEVTDETDENGWRYGSTFGNWDSFTPDNHTLDFCRVRKLVRSRIKESNRVAKGLDFTTSLGVRAKGSNMTDLIQHGIRMANLKDRRPNDHHSRYYLNLETSRGTAYQFQDYAPHTFWEIRGQYGISDDDYVTNMCDSPYKGGDTEDSGKSGSIFWRSHNNAFVIKTITAAEAELLVHMVRDYQAYLKESKHTLISRFFGLHKIKAYGKRLRFVVMNNVFQDNIPIQLVFDLKGTTEDRLVHQDSTLNDQPVLKDLNFINRYMIVSSDMMEALQTQIERDTDFLTRVDVMDYSLLLGIASCEKDEDRKEVTDLTTELVRHQDSDGTDQLTKKSIFEIGVDGLLSERYYIGIIDILQDWTTVKKMANYVKTVRYVPRGIKIDSVPPAEYAPRFVKYFKEKIVDQESKSETHFTLSIIVESGKSLKVCDKFSSSSDPYVRIEFGYTVSSTQVLKRNVNPVWNHLCVFKFNNEDEYPDTVGLSCWDWDRGSSPDFIGQSEINISKYFTNSVPEQLTLNLVDPKNQQDDFLGSISVTVELTDNRDAETKTAHDEDLAEIYKIGEIALG